MDGKRIYPSLAVSKSREELGTLTLPLLKLQADITVAEKRIEKVSAQIDVQEVKVGDAIRVAFEQMRSDLDQREVQLRNKLTRMVQEKRDALTSQLSGLQAASDEIQDVLDYVQQNLETASDGDLISIRTSLEEKVREKERQHANISLHPTASADMASDLPLPSSDKAASFGDVFLATIVQPPIAEFGKKSAVTLKVHNSRDLKLLHVDASFTSLANPAVATPVQVENQGRGEYRIHYVPGIRGRHDLAVTVNGENIPGSPFRVFVKIHPTKITYPVITSDYLGRPFGIIAAPKGELVVAQNGGKELTFTDRKLTKLRSIKTERFYFPRGVAVGPDGAIYSTDKGIEYTLMKFEDMKLTKAVNKGSQSVVLLKIINDYLYACDMGLSEVHIFTLNLEHISSFHTPEAPNPHDLAEGEDGLYVVSGAEYGARIAVYTHEGEFLRQITVKGATLSCMRGICFDSYRHMFITQVGSGVEGVYVFTTTGDLITSFGLASNKIMEHPVGITIDEDGFVYVCDHKPLNKRVLKF